MKALKVIAWIFGSFLLLLLAIALIVQIPAVQLKIAKYATAWITDKTHGRVEIEDFRIKFPKTIVLKGLYLEDLTKDTLVSVGLFKIDLTLSALLHQKVQIHSLNLEDVVVHISRGAKDSLFNYAYLMEAFSSESKSPKKPSAPWTIGVNKFRLNNLRVRFDDFREKKHLAYSNIQLSANDAYYKVSKLGVSIQQFQLAHSSFEGELALGYDSLNTLMKDPSRTTVKIRVNKLLIYNGDVLDILPDLDSIPYFNNRSLITSFSGDIHGPINHLTGKGIDIQAGSDTRLRTSFHVDGLPDYKTVTVDFPSIRIHSGRKDFALLGNLTQSMEFPEIIDLQLMLKGTMKAFKASGNMTSSFGNGRFSGNLDEKEQFTALVSLNAFNVGRLMRKPELMGTMTLEAKANGHGLSLSTLRTKIDVTAKQFELNKYTYHNLVLHGIVAGMGFDGTIKLNDENAAFDFKGKVDMNGKQALAHFRFDLKGADLKKLNFMTTDTRMAFSIVANLKGEMPRRLIGRATIKDILVMHEGVKYPLDSMEVETVNLPGSCTLKVHSKLIDLDYKGSLFPTEIAGEVLAFVQP
jgi:hypothetical protein